MGRNVSRSHRALSITVVLLVILALLPVSWLRWTAVGADLVAVPVQPMADAAVRMGRWVRPADREMAVASQAVKERTQEIEATRALLHAARLTIEALEEEISALQEARRYQPDLEVNPVFARVTGRPPQRGQGPVRINAGTRQGVVPGTVAVYRGGHLIGRVADNIARLTSQVIPITDPSTGLMEAVILPADDPVAALASAPRVQLVPDGSGGLVGDLDRTVAVSAGDLVRLADPSWPASAQGTIIGFVESVQGKDLQPLLNSITVAPRYHAQRVASMTLMIERVEEALGGGGT